MYQAGFSVSTEGRGLVEITRQINNLVADAKIESGIAHLFLQHTSASLIITENADPTVLGDLETVFARLAPDGDPQYRHDYEGDDDMAAHVRSVLTINDLSIPVSESKLALGTWQGVFLWEHRYRAHVRKLILTVTACLKI
ncbi:MAG: YjbQ family protein [Gammaproteobacteria bacterium]|nr:YjbQ family protein [Gammaproteobacteria bacterium]